MSTLGWVLILTALILIRQVTKGRVMDLPTDLSDAFLAIARADTTGLQDVLARSGPSNTPLETPDGTSDSVSTGTGLASVIVALGSAAKGYRWASSGPDYYDCSGLVYAAVKKLGYTGLRFTTSTLPGSHFRRISSPAMQGPGITNASVNDIVLWPAGSGGVTGHMGVITGKDTFYSARNSRTGIGYSKISTFRRTQPIYYRYVR